MQPCVLLWHFSFFKSLGFSYVNKHEFLMLYKVHKMTLQNYISTQCNVKVYLKYTWKLENVRNLSRFSATYPFLITVSYRRLKKAQCCFLYMTHQKGWRTFRLISNHLSVWLAIISLFWTKSVKYNPSK